MGLLCHLLFLCWTADLYLAWRWTLGKTPMISYSRFVGLHIMRSKNSFWTFRHFQPLLRDRLTKSSFCVLSKEPYRVIHDSQKRCFTIRLDDGGEERRGELIKSFCFSSSSHIPEGRLYCQNVCFSFPCVIFSRYSGLCGAKIHLQDRQTRSLAVHHSSRGFPRERCRISPGGGDPSDLICLFQDHANTVAC